MIMWPERVRNSEIHTIGAKRIPRHELSRAKKNTVRVWVRDQR